MESGPCARSRAPALRQAVSSVVWRPSAGVEVTGWEIPAGVVVTIVLAVGGWVWRLATKLASQDDRITAAATAASNASAKASLLERELSEHREHVAAEYVSRATMGEVTVAINRLGDRLDNFFIQFIRKPE